MAGSPLNGRDPSGLSTCGEVDDWTDVIGSAVDCVANSDPQDAVDGIKEVAQQGPVASFKTGADGVYRAPDYYTLDVSFPVFGPFQVGFVVTVTRDGDLNFGLQDGFGWGPSGAVRAGWRNQIGNPSACETEQLVKGHSSTVSGGAHFISVGRSSSTNGKSSTEVGVGAGQGANGSWSGQYLWHATDLW